uniref:Ig-like domain-containing protein n=1 Tax=Sinocyclocheilus anshuiensis TaxID=1608454 RepID=A0A671Q1T5_9TELE
LKTLLRRVISFNLCVSFANVITPVQTEVSKKEGENVTLSCSYSSASTLQWYRQYPGSAPEFLLIILHATGKTTTSQSSTELTITSLTMSDSALYYCALRVGAQ